MGLFDSIKEAFESDPQKLADWTKQLDELHAKLPSASGKDAAEIQKEIDDLSVKVAGLKSKLGISDGPQASADIVPDPMASPAPEAPAEQAAAADGAPAAEAVPAPAPEPAPAPVVEAPAPAAPPPPPPAPEHRTYTVKPGDTLSKIGREFGVNYMEIVKLNHIKNPDLIYPGQVFQIPN